jgi:hypothetical protein
MGGILLALDITPHIGWAQVSSIVVRNELWKYAVVPCPLIQ